MKRRSFFSSLAAVLPLPWLYRNPRQRDVTIRDKYLADLEVSIVKVRDMSEAERRYVVVDNLTIDGCIFHQMRPVSPGCPGCDTWHTPDSFEIRIST